MSSYPKYFKKKARDGLCRGDFLSILGMPDSLAGMRRYAAHLELKEKTDPRQRDKLSKRYCRGWFIGEKEARKALEKDLREKHPDVVWDGTDMNALNEAMWDRFFAGRMADAGKTEADLLSDRKGADWKAKIARELRAGRTAGNIWIAKRLNMGHPSRVTNLIRNAWQ